MLSFLTRKETVAYVYTKLFTQVKEIEWIKFVESEFHSIILVCYTRQF